MRQQTLASQASFEKFGRKGKRELFLDRMEQVVPWPELLALAEPHYPKAGNGRQPVGLPIMLRTYFLQQWFNLSDAGYQGQTEAIREAAPAAQDMTCSRIRFKNCVDEEAKNKTKSSVRSKVEHPFRI